MFAGAWIDLKGASWEPEAEIREPTLRTALPVASPVHLIYVVCRDPQAGGGARSFCRPQSTQNQMIPRPAVTSCPRPYLHLGWPLEYAGDSKPVARALEVRFIPLASTCPVAWRCLMRHVSLHPSSFALPPGLRPRSNGHRRMPRQNRLRPSPHSLRKICRRAMGEAGGASFDHLVGAQQKRF